MSIEPTIKSDLARLDEMPDDMIDYSDIPSSTDEQLAAMRPLKEILPAVYSRIQASIRLDEDVRIWFEKQAESTGVGGFSELVNAALRQYIQQQG